MKRIGVFTSGGDAPGMNACIRAVVRASCQREIEVYGIREGLQGMVENKIALLQTQDVANIIQRGGTILQSSRSKEFKTPTGREKSMQNLKTHGIEGLVCIGGDGSYAAMKVFNKEFSIPVIGCPGTIDNDIYGTDFTIGFDTAVNTVVEAVDKIRDTAESHNNVFFVEVMGRHSGAIALYSGISSGAESILLPEVTNDYDDLILKFKNKSKRKKRFSIVIVAEGDEEGNAIQIANKFKNSFPELSPKVTVLGHIQRGGAPSANDRILASRLGAAAVEALIDGKTNFALGVVDNNLTFTPLEKAINNKKEFNFDFYNLAEILSL
ncbi:MAG: 6-phosphofructokinase [Bacteroidetes bacterium]|nr:6-phosphofructokinase [Bacteroidota bacterium]